MPRVIAASISLGAKLCCELPHGGNYRGIRKGFGFLRTILHPSSYKHPVLLENTLNVETGFMSTR